MKKIFLVFRDILFFWFFFQFLEFFFFKKNFLGNKNKNYSNDLRVIEIGNFFHDIGIVFIGDGEIFVFLHVVDIGPDDIKIDFIFVGFVPHISPFGRGG